MSEGKKTKTTKQEQQPKSKPTPPPGRTVRENEIPKKNSEQLNG